MANIVTETYMQNLLKTVYDNEVTNSKAQSSPLIQKMKKENWVGGKEFAYATQYGNGGNVGSNLAQEVSQAYSGAQNAEWKMKYGTVNAYFDIDSPDMLASENEQGAYMSILGNKMGAAFDLIGKTAALYFYGGKYGVIEKLTSQLSVTQGSGNTVTVSSSAGLKLQPGIKFVFATSGVADTSVPSSPLDSAICTVDSVDDSGDDATISFTSTATTTIASGAYIELFAARNGSEGIGYEGLYDIIPTLDDRTGANWGSYIADDFRGIDRSVAVSGLAGQFVKAASTGATRRADALVKLLKKTQRYGGIDDIIVINDDTLGDIYSELDAKGVLRQSADGATAGRKSATFGFNQFSTAFGDSFIDRVVRDPYCMNGTAYMLKEDDLVFKTVSNAGRVFDAVGNDQLGKYDVKSIGDGGLGNNINNSLNYDKLFTVYDGQVGVFDAAKRVVAKVFGNFMIKNVSACGAASLK